MIFDKLKFILLILICCMSIDSLHALDRTVDNTTYEPDSSLIITGDKSSVGSETKDVGAGTSVTVVYYKEYNQAIFIINVKDKKYGYDEAEVETLFKNTIEMWIQDKAHRYYSYQVNGRHVFHSRKDRDGDKIVSTEYRVILYRN